MYSPHLVMILVVLYIPFNLICAVIIEREHLQALDKAEQEFSDIIVSDLKNLPPNWTVKSSVFLSDDVCLANDSIKSLFWTFRTLFGGESKSFTRLMDRARREATLRLLRKARMSGMNAVWNIRYETSVIRLGFGSADNGKFAGVEIFVYATCFDIQA
jgi:uncharacterized protein YbjQ (UPF0145 family)